MPSEEQDCLLCPAGRYSAGYGNTACSVCTVTNGKYNTECSTCVADTYDSNPGGRFQAEGCISCAQGEYSEGVGNQACTACTVTNGRYGPECSNCPPNTYDDEPGGFNNLRLRDSHTHDTNPELRRCVACPAGKYSTGSGNQACSDCIVTSGKYNWECSTCPHNTYDSRPGGNSQGQGCVACVEGKYSVGEGNSVCPDCTVTSGKYNPECSICPPNSRETKPGGNFLGEGCETCTTVNGDLYEVGHGNQACPQATPSPTP